MRVVKGVGLAFVAVMITSCDFSPEGILGEDPVEEAMTGDTAIAVGHSVGCNAPSPTWLVSAPDSNLPSFCDRMMNAFPLIETVGQDGTLRLSVRKLDHGTFPTIGAVAYRNKEAFPGVAFKCADETEASDRKSYLCKPDWNHAIGPTQQNNDQVSVEPWVVTLKNEACGNIVGFQVVWGDYSCPTGLNVLSQSPCLNGGSLGACASGPGPLLWVSLQ